jgi:uncharacterized membrane protein
LTPRILPDAASPTLASNANLPGLGQVLTLIFGTFSLVIIVELVTDIVRSQRPTYDDIFTKIQRSEAGPLALIKALTLLMTGSLFVIAIIVLMVSALLSAPWYAIVIARLFGAIVFAIIVWFSAIARIRQKAEEARKSAKYGVRTIAWYALGVAVCVAGGIAFVWIAAS